MDYFLLQIGAGGVPGMMFGPGTWKNCVDQFEKVNKTISAADLEHFDSDGMFEFDSDNQWYIVTSDKFTE